MTRMFWTAAVLLVALLAAGCNVDKQYTWDYGRAYHSVFENQKLNPDAGDDTPVVGQSGTVAAAAYTRYEKAEPPKDEKRTPVILDFNKK